MGAATYDARRGELETYFDRTAVEAWKRLTSDAPVGRIRATVRAGRDSMRGALLSWLPADMSGLRLLDAGCGTGALAIEAARRGAEVVAIDISPTLVGLAHERAPRDLGAGRVTFRVGDMLDPTLGRFDHVVAMDSLRGDRHCARARRARRAHASFDRLHDRAAHAGADCHARGRPAVPARRPRARDRADLAEGARAPDEGRARP
jgi:magnesium-protoporphyrin O-methyltransferase